MSEELVSAFNVVVYVFDVKPNQWVKKGVARLSIFEDVFSMKYRIVARSAVLINSYIFTGMSPREDTGNFVQWADQRLLYGVRFDKPSHSKQFLSTVNDYIDQVSLSQAAPEEEQLAKVELDEKYCHVRTVLEIMLSDYNRFFGHFGQTYDTLGCVPARLRSAIELLESNLHTPYLLGAKLEYAQLQKAEELFNAADDPDMAQHDLPVVGEYLRIFFKNRTPLMVMDNHEPIKSFVAIGDDYEEQADYILALVNSLPDENRQLLQVLIWLLANVAWNTEHNLLSMELISAMFAPYLLQPQSLEYAKPEKVKLKKKLAL